VIRGMPPASSFQSPQKRDVTGRVTLLATAPRTKPAKAIAAVPAVNFKSLERDVPDLVVPAGKICHFAELDLGKLDYLPAGRQDFTALSIRIEAAFLTDWKSVLALVAEDHQDISQKVLGAVASKLALDFIERYGALGLLSASVIEVLWEAQRPKSENGLKRLQEVGERLAIFAKAQRGPRPMKTIGISFKLAKPDFISEIERLSRDLGDSPSIEPWADQLLGFVKMGEYTMLKLNLTWLEHFLRCQQMNPDLNGKNAMCADLLAEYGIGRVLREKREPLITPEWFFYTWIAWITNKKRSTVRREIKTAETTFKTEINELIRVTKNR
jgi:hypothetical protein